jgi:hypothetical protein
MAHSEVVGGAYGRVIQPLARPAHSCQGFDHAPAAAIAVQDVEDVQLDAQRLNAKLVCRWRGAGQAGGQASFQ